MTMITRLYSVATTGAGPVLGCALALGAAGCAESRYHVRSAMPVLLGPVDTVGGAARPLEHAGKPGVQADYHREGGSLGMSIDNSGIDAAIAAAARRAGLGAETGDVRVGSLSTGAHIFYSIPYLPYPIMTGRTWLRLEGNVAPASGGAR